MSAVVTSKRKMEKIGFTKVMEVTFSKLMTLSGAFLVLLLLGIFVTLIIASFPAIQHTGLNFLFGKTWDPVIDEYGSLPFLVGTLLTSILALIISAPFSLALALLLGEFYKKGTLSEIFRNIIELMAGVPSVIYGFAAFYFLTPAIRSLETQLGYPPYGVGILTAAIVLSIMVVPYWASVAREVITLTPKDLKEAAYSLGATRYEMVKNVVLPITRPGIIAGMLLALGRALGETMAVTMVIGNTNELPSSIFDPSNTMASVIANEFTEATTDLYLSALVEIALLLFLVSAILNIVGKLIIRKMVKK